VRAAVYVRRVDVRAVTLIVLRLRRPRRVIGLRTSAPRARTFVRPLRATVTELSLDRSGALSLSRRRPRLMQVLAGGRPSARVEIGAHGERDARRVHRAVGADVRLAQA
jgi:hypothetical protein